MVIVYHPDYNISVMGIERLHPFDSHKYRHVHERLEVAGFLARHQVVRPEMPQRTWLLTVHGDHYLRSLDDSSTIADLVEVPAAAMVPALILRKRLLEPMLLATAGTLLACRKALECGLAVNLGGGYHHASANMGGGFSIYADITLALRTLLREGLVTKVLYVDLDAHQGNGPGRDFLDDGRVFIFDVFNREIFPMDGVALGGIDKAVGIASGTTGDKYLRMLREEMPRLLRDVEPDLVFYNAGTDVYERDPLGQLALTREDIVERDGIVVGAARAAGVPLAMTLSGGYTKESAGIIAESILAFEA